MKNLAGDMGCDTVIRQELATARVELVEHGKRLDREVPASVTGQLTLNGEPVFVFKRAWYYWVVSGDVPLEVAQEIYADPVGQQDVRVVGHCGCPPPEEWAFPTKEMLRNRREIDAPRFVKSYHIDSQEGVNLFVATVRKHDLAD